MTQWKNLDTLASFGELAKVQKVNLVEAMSGQNGADRVKKYNGHLSISYKNGITTLIILMDNPQKQIHS